MSKAGDILNKLNSFDDGYNFLDSANVFERSMSRLLRQIKKILQLLQLLGKKTQRGLN